MGEEGKKQEDGKKEETKSEEKKDGATKVEDGKKDAGATGEGSKDVAGGGEEKKDEASPPPEEIVMKVFMHCEGCARKVKRCLRGFSGVEDVMTDSKSHKVVVKGKKAAADPMKIVDRVAKKTGRKVELLTPLPAPKPVKEEEKKEEEKPKPEEKKEEPPVIVTVVLKVHMHCEACAQEIQKKILKMKGVQTAEADLKASQVTVKGIFQPQKLVEYVNKRFNGRKQAVIVKQEPAEKKTEEEKKGDGAGDTANKDDKKSDGNGDKAPEGDKKDDKDGKSGDDKENKDNNSGLDDLVKVDLMRSELQYYPNRISYSYYQQNPHYPPPQLFSDENPNACTVM